MDKQYNMHSKLMDWAIKGIAVLSRGIGTIKYA